MDPELSFFIAIMTLMILGTALLNAWINSRAKIRIADSGRLDSARQVELLSNENAGLKGQMSRLEERIAVLERIATDPADRTLREIEQLR